MLSTLTANETIHFLAGPAGQLETIIGKPTHGDRQAWGIVCHPHPLFGGTMHNKVVTTLVKTFQGLGLHTVRFNFRGVGKSEGEYGHGEGELEDLLAVIDWVGGQGKMALPWLAGFSFGAYVSSLAAVQVPLQTLVTVAPPVENFPMQNLPPIECPWVLVQGDLDEVVAANRVIEWAMHRQPQPVILRFPLASHFFHGQLVDLRIQLEALLRDIS